MLLFLASLSTDPAPATRLWWGDWNGDGRLDLVRCAPGDPARLLENRGAGVFVDVSDTAGWPRVEGLVQVAFTDLDGDGRTELVLVAGGRVRLLAREGDGLVERTEPTGLAALEGVAGLRPIDVDDDGLPELWITSAEGERVLRRTPGGAFEELDLGFPRLLRTEVVGWETAVNAVTPEVEAPGPGARGSPPPAAGSGERPTGGVIGSESPSAGRGPAVPPGSCEEPLPTGVWSLAACDPFVRDSTTGSCLQAFSTPTLGHLYPLSNALNVHTGGNVGMGTTTPTHKLTVKAGGNDNVLRLIGKQGASQHGARLNFGDGDHVLLEEGTNDQLLIKAQSGLSLLAPGGSLRVDTSGGTNFSSGNVGIGQSSPAWALDVRKPQAVGRFITQTSSNGSVIDLRTEVVGPTFVGALNFTNSLGQTRGQIAYSGADELAFRVNNAEVARFYSDGLVDFNGPLTAKVDTTGSVAYFENQSTAPLSNALVGFAHGANTGAVVGWNTAATGTGSGVRGVTSVATGYGVYSAGDFGGSGAKFFVQPHPEDASQEIRFVSLEGNEAGTYFRGRARILAGQAVIEVPEDFRLVTEAEGLTVQTTPIGAPAVLWIASQDLDRIVVRSNVDVEFNYFANGVRRGFAGLETMRANAAFVPRERGVPYGTQYREDHRRILVENGTLNPDFTPNEATAARLGWKLAEPNPDTPRVP